MALRPTIASCKTTSRNRGMVVLMSCISILGCSTQDNQLLVFLKHRQLKEYQTRAERWLYMKRPGLLHPVTAAGHSGQSVDKIKAIVKYTSDSDHMCPAGLQ